MNVLVVGRFYEEGFALHIATTLEAMGHAVRHFEPGASSGRLPGVLGHRIDAARALFRTATDSVAAVRRWRMQPLYDVADASVDVTIVCHDFLWPEEVRELKRRTGGVVAMWFPDALVNFQRGYFMNAPYDALFFKDPFIIERLADVLASEVHYLPECFNPAVHREPSGHPSTRDFDCEVTTAGNPHAYRVAVMRHLAEFDVKLWGPPMPAWLQPGPVGRMHQGRYVMSEEKALAFCRAKIVLNNLHYSEIWGINVRTFEAAGVGAFQLVDWRPGLAQLFEDGVELVTFRGVADMKSKIRYWLPRDAERAAIAGEGKRRAHRDHTYRKRMDLLLETLAGRARAYPLPELA